MPAITFECHNCYRTTTEHTSDIVNQTLCRSCRMTQKDKDKQKLKDKFKPKGFTITTTTITAKLRKLKAKWTRAFAKDLKKNFKKHP